MAAGLIFTSIQTNKKYKFKRKAEDIHSELLEAKHFLDPNTALSLINKGDEKYVFVDIRNPRDYDNFHIESAVNVPMQRVLDDEYVPYLKDDRIKVLYSENSIDAEQVRLLLTQYGYQNLMVLQGGASYWEKNMLSRNVFKATAEYDDEKLQFDPNNLSAK
jgi:rhodanese-related sulfurtransferase